MRQPCRRTPRHHPAERTCRRWGHPARSRPHGCGRSIPSRASSRGSTRPTRDGAEAIVASTSLRQWASGSCPRPPAGSASPAPSLGAASWSSPTTAACAAPSSRSATRSRWGPPCAAGKRSPPSTGPRDTASRAPACTGGSGAARPTWTPSPC
ncbi:hypothetical protein N864_24145 [Intrasporangium chromatireducens Q5-1]|uniref:Uncharacterized protein n=1 Tax=Intrasporangium chromatireducens Q5-1 TaxID=584657 RepID=W9GMQ7_9MICO|nr:hypothetical protein N864_24145 [Intrasporangium chromatireducens Q5-1]